MKSRHVLAGVVAVSGILHFLFTDSYAQVVPRVLGNERFWVQASGVAEIGCAALLIPQKTHRIGGWLTAFVFVAVFPANIKMALEGGILAWLRLPFQVPLIWWAIRSART